MITKRYKDMQVVKARQKVKFKSVISAVLALVFFYATAGAVFPQTTAFAMESNDEVTYSGGSVFSGNRRFEIKDDGSLWAWGANNHGQLGDGTRIDRDESNPFMIMESGVRFVDHVSPLITGVYHTMVIKDDGSLWAWGRNDYGQLGDGTTIDRLRPVKIMDGVSVRNPRDVHGQPQAQLGEFHSLVLKAADTTLWAWGRNDAGQLGDGTIIDRHQPVQILDDVLNILWTGNTSLVARNDFTDWSWGAQVQGQFDADGNLKGSLVPVQVFDVISVTVDGRLLTFDASPYMSNNRVLVPLRGIFEALGAAVDWQQATQTITATKGDTVVKLIIGDSSPTVNGVVVPIDEPATVGWRNRTFVPLRFIGEALGVSVDWNSQTWTVEIRS